MFWGDFERERVSDSLLPKHIHTIGTSSHTSFHRDFKGNSSIKRACHDTSVRTTDRQLRVLFSFNS